jgi:HSP20 family protein
MLTLGTELDQLFKRAAEAGGSSAEGTLAYPSAERYPPLDIYENEEGLVVRLEAPGFKKENLALSLKEEVLTIAGTSPEAAPETQRNVCRCEVARGPFERTVTLPYPVESDKIKATFADGILTVTLPKAEAAKPKTIPVEIK